MIFDKPVAHLAALLALVSLVAAAGNKNDIFNHKVGYDGQKDLWYLADEIVSAQTQASKFEQLSLKPFSNVDYPELHYNFVLGQQSPKRVGSMDDRWDVRNFKQFQFFALYDGINSPSVVNRLRSILLREVGNYIYQDLESLDAQFAAAKNGGADAMAEYLETKHRVFVKISQKIKEVEEYNRLGTSKSAAAGVIAIVSPNFVIVAQVGSVHIMSYKHLTPVSLTVDQSRQGPDSPNFGLAECKDYFQQELCLHTRVFGAATYKDDRTSRPSHISEPFIKLYKRVYAPFLNDNDLVMGANSFRPDPRFDFAKASTSELDTANMPVKHTDLDGIPAGDEQAISDALEDENSLKYLLFTTHPIRRYLNPENIARIVAQNMHEAFRRDAGTLKSIMIGTLREIIESARDQSQEGWTGFVNSFFSDVTVILVPLVTEAERYHF